MKYCWYKFFLENTIALLVLSNTLELLLLLQFTSASLVIQSSKSFSQELKQKQQDKIFNNNYDDNYPWNKFNLTQTQKLCQDGSLQCKITNSSRATGQVIFKPTKRVIIGVLESVRHSNRKDNTWINPYKDCDGITASLCAIKAKGHYYSWITQRENRLKKNEKLLTKIGR